MIQASHRRPIGEWYLADEEDVAPLIDTINGLKVLNPGAKIVDKNLRTYQIHRSHLPLLETGGQFRGALAKEAWSARDEKYAKLGIELRTTQHQAADFIEPRRGALLADEMRLGKTLSCLISHDPVRGPLVIVAPKSARAVWLGWMRRLWPGEPIGIAIGTKLEKHVLEKKLIFIHYEIAAKWQAIFKIGTLVFDEAHAITNPQAKRSVACALLAARAEKIIPTTGTPIYTRPIDLWNILATIAPGAWGSIYDFGHRYCGARETGYGTVFDGVSHQHELSARLSEAMIRRLWKDCHDDLPAIQRSVAVAEVDKVARKRLDIIAASLRTERSNTASTLAQYRVKIFDVKLPLVKAKAIRLYEANEPQVIWAWHKESAVKIDDALCTSDSIHRDDVFMAHGDISSEKRETIFDAWKASARGILIITMAVGQVAIDLSHARFATFAELDWTPLVIAQAEMRTFSPLRSMSIEFIVADHVVEQRMVRSLISKLSTSDPLGLASAIDSIEAIRDVVDGPQDSPDMQRFLDDLFSSEVHYV